jgi:hypothetical protein
VFDDGSRKEATLVEPADLPVNFYVLLVERRPVRLEALHHFGGGEWVDEPVPSNMPCGDG